MKISSISENLSITFIGEVMLGREVGEKYIANEYQLVSTEIKKHLNKSDFVIANLEAPINDNRLSEDHLMIFNGKSKTLKEVSFVNVFSLANNHINDTGTEGILSTIENLEKQGFLHNGIYKKEYQPLLFDKENNKIAIICCTDILNDEIDKDFEESLLWLNNKQIPEIISKYKEEGYFVMIYVHGGIMFTRYPNPIFRKDMHALIDEGADCVVTLHPHVLGGYETYKDKFIFYSLGDFIMDGHSERRREAALLNLKIKDNLIVDFNIMPTFINKELQATFAQNKKKEKIIRSWEKVSSDLKKIKDFQQYEIFYKKQFKKELAYHILSTLHFQFKYKSTSEIFLLVFNRFKDFKNMSRWFFKDTSKMRNNLEDKSML